MFDRAVCHGHHRRVSDHDVATGHGQGLPQGDAANRLPQENENEDDDKTSQTTPSHHLKRPSRGIKHDPSKSIHGNVPFELRSGLLSK
jgi:hypothetical protein